MPIPWDKRHVPGKLEGRAVMATSRHGDVDSERANCPAWPLQSAGASLAAGAEVAASVGRISPSRPQQTAPREWAFRSDEPHSAGRLHPDRTAHPEWFRWLSGG